MGPWRFSRNDRAFRGGGRDKNAVVGWPTANPGQEPVANCEVLPRTRLSGLRSGLENRNRIHQQPLKSAHSAGLRGCDVCYLGFLRQLLNAIILRKGIAEEGSADCRAQSVQLKGSVAIYAVRVRPFLHPFYHVGEWLSLVEHLVRDQGVGGSNPLSPTNPFFTVPAQRVASLPISAFELEAI